jgi:hypothetical protein
MAFGGPPEHPPKPWIGRKIERPVKQPTILNVAHGGTAAVIRKQKSQNNTGAVKHGYHNRTTLKHLARCDAK